MIRIVRRGKPVAQITAIGGSRKPVDVAALAALTRRMPVRSENAETFTRAMRDSERY